MSNWKIGDKAVCITRYPEFWDFAEHINENPPVHPNIYIVTQVVVDGHGRTGLMISGCGTYTKLRNFLGFPKRGPEAGWDSNQFRKLVPACDRAEVWEDSK